MKKSGTQSMQLRVSDFFTFHLNKQAQNHDTNDTDNGNQAFQNSPS